MSRRTRRKLPHSGIDVLYSPNVERVTFEMRYRNLPTVIATWSTRHRQWDHIAVHTSTHGGKVADIATIPTHRLQTLLEQALAEFRSIYL